MSAKPAVRSRTTAQERRAQIVDVATHLFSQHGFGGVTMAMLAGECGVTEPALYRYFNSKEELYEAVLTSLKDRLNIGEALAGLAALDDIEELLFGVARYIIGTYGSNTELSRLLLLSALEGHPLAKRAFDDLRMPFVKFLTQKFESLKRRNRIRDVHPQITARCFIGMVMDCALSLHLWRDFQGPRYDPKDVIQNNVQIYVAGLRPTGQDD
ncbi:MAG: hypothetical protein Kow0074_22700 [Candidatus Zixiibacteriota bacterium]